MEAAKFAADTTDSPDGIANNRAGSVAEDSPGSEQAQGQVSPDIAAADASSRG